MLTDAQKHDLVDRNVAMLADAPRVSPRRPSTFTPEETARILAQLPHVRLGRMFLFVALTGLRASEARGLRWADVDLDAGTYTVVKGLHRVGAAGARVAPVGIVESHPKTDGSGETTPMSPAAAEVLREHRLDQHRERLAAPVWHDRGYVFTNKIGGALEPTTVRRVWIKVLADAGVTYRPDPARPGRGLHELRRTFATRLRDAGIPLEDVQALGRWSSSQVLLASYAGTSDVRLRAAAQAAADAILGRP
jgi:integrase